MKRGKRMFIFYLIIAAILINKDKILEYEGEIDDTGLLMSLSHSIKIREKEQIHKIFNKADKIQ